MLKMRRIVTSYFDDRKGKKRFGRHIGKNF